MFGLLYLCARVAGRLVLLSLVFACTATALGQLPANAPGPPQTAVLARVVKVKVTYGEVELPAGQRLQLVGADANTVRVTYLNDVVTLPRDVVTLESIATPVPQQRPTNKLNPVNPAPVAPAAPQLPAIALRPGWDTQMQGGSATMRELQALLSPHAQAAIDTRGAGIEIYGGVRYLMDAREAADALGLGGATPSEMTVATPGFPRGTFSYVAYDGMFEGRFNRLCLVTDAAHRVVCLQLMNEHTRRVENDPPGGWNTYNFVNTRVCVSPTARAHDASHRAGDVIHIETHFYQKEPRRGWDEREETKLLIPLPLARLILHCIQTGTTRSM